MNNLHVSKNRRKFLQHLMVGTAGSLALGWFYPRSSESREANLEQLCSLYPNNSRCENYLPGVEAKDSEGNPIQADKLLGSSTAGKPVAVEGLERTTYLIITDKPAIAEYGINPTCTHLGCTVNWQPEKDRFVCPCHGSQYDSQGRVLKGPAQHALPLVTVVVKQNQVRLVNRAPAIDPRQPVKDS